jgi:hypothetical protein
VWKSAALLAKVIEARKVYGTHWAVDSEDQPSYEALIEQWERMLEEFIDELTTTAEEASFALPVLVLTTGVDYDAVTNISAQIQEQLDRANGLIGAEVLT